MKYKFLLLSITFFLFLFGFSQNSSSLFAITGQSVKNFNWMDIRSLNMKTGNVEQVLFENGKTEYSYTNSENKSQINEIVLNGNPAKLSLGDTHFSSQQIILKNPTPTSLMTAATAFDQRHNRLFFSTMHDGRLIWLDLAKKNKASFFTIQKPLIVQNDYNDEALNITRMTIGSDGYGYALTNDANHLIRFSTGKKIVVSDLGALLDDENNKGISIHNKCTSWGGDIVADASGKLYLFSAGRQVFEIDIDTKVATLKGAVLNLPATYTLNGAAVNEIDEVIVSSANTYDGFYAVNMKDYTATKLPTTSQVFNASDLASSNLLFQNKKTGSAVLRKEEVMGNKFISLFPNPVRNGEVKIVFENHLPGQYKIALTDIQGRMIENSTVNIQYPGEAVNFKMKTKPVKGVYMIKITNQENFNIYSDKLVVE